MDALSSMATLAGYKAAVLAAAHLPKIFPLMMTAAGTIKPARVLVIGAGVAGLQALGHSPAPGRADPGLRRAPGRPRAGGKPGRQVLWNCRWSRRRRDERRLCQSHGRRVLRRQGELLAQVAAANDVVIATAAVPGKRAPRATDGRDGPGHGAGVGDRGPGRRTRRQLRADPPRPDGRRTQRDDHGSGQPARDRSLSCQSDAGPQHHGFSEKPDSEGRPALDADDEIIRETMVVREGKLKKA